MGLFLNYKAAAQGGWFVAGIKKDYAKFRNQNPDKEPFEFMINAWWFHLEKADKMALAISGRETVKLYGCLPSPLCVEMMAHQMCRYLIPGSSGSLPSQQEWGEVMFGIARLYDSCDAENLNALFRTYNPRCYVVILAETGQPPFDQQKMVQNKDWQKLLGLT